MTTSYPRADDERFVAELEALQGLETLEVTISTTERHEVGRLVRVERFVRVEWDDTSTSEDAALATLGRLSAAGLDVKLTRKATEAEEECRAEVEWRTHNEQAALIGARTTAEEATS